MKKYLFLFFLLVFAKITYATHERGGYIAYSPLGAGMYKFSIHTWTSISTQSQGADRCELTLYIDGTNPTVCPRVNGTGPCPNGGNPGDRDGVVIIPQSGAYGGVKTNIYEGTHHLSPGMHIFTVIDANRDYGIINLGGANSGSIAFAITDTLYLYNSTYNGLLNNGPVLSFPPVDNICSGSVFDYNPGIVDPDNDSLIFSIVKSIQDNASTMIPADVMTISSEIIPAGMTIDKHTGHIHWDSTQIQGEYDVSILITEFRRNPYNGSCNNWYVIGKTLLDIQLYVVACAPKNMAFNLTPANTCLVAGTTFTTQISGNGNGAGILAPLGISAKGLPISSTTIGNNAIITSTPTSNSVTGVFSWTPSCLAAQLNSYPVYFQLFDSKTPTANANYKVFYVKVIAPGPTNLTATNLGTSVSLNWNGLSNCGQATGDTLQSYYLYRVDSCVSFVPSSCQTGVPTTGGYLFLASLAPTTTAYNDTGLAAGKTYSYLVVAHFSDCSQSMASSAACVITDIGSHFFDENISFLPNPSNGFIQLKVSLLSASDLKINITNTLGEVVFSKRESNVRNDKFGYDFSFLAKGIYFAHVEDMESHQAVKKIIIE